MDLNEKILSQEKIFDGEIIKLRIDTVKTPSDTTATREIVEHPGGVCILPLDENGNVIMEWQYRHPFTSLLYELPAGKLIKGEDPLECGKRELEEETGLCAREYISLGKIYPTPGFSTDTIHPYIARNISNGPENPDQDEIIVLETEPLEKLVDKVLSGEICDAKTCVALLKANEMKNRGLI